MRKINNPFIASYPEIDIHGYDRESAAICVRQFIEDSLKLKEYNIVIIHGIGKGILRSEVQKVLHNHKDVLDFKIDNFNEGITIVNLKQ